MWTKTLKKDSTKETTYLMKLQNYWSFIFDFGITKQLCLNVNTQYPIIIPNTLKQNQRAS